MKLAQITELIRKEKIRLAHLKKIAKKGGLASKKRGTDYAKLARKRWAKARKKLSPGK